MNRTRAVSVALIRVQRQAIQNTIFASGLIKAVNRQIITTNQLQSGTFSYQAEVGSLVHVGQILVQSDDTVQMAALRTAEVSLASAEKTLVQVKQGAAASPSLSAQLDVANAQSTVSAARAQVHQAEAAVELTKIKATIAGQVILENPTGVASDGSSAPILEVVGSGREIQANVSEVDAVHLQVGMKATVTTEAYPTHTWQAKITRIAPYAVTNSNGSGQVEVDLSPNGHPFNIPLDYQVDLHIVSETHPSALVIPYDALVPEGNGYSVFVYAANRHVRLQSVTIGITSDTEVEVLKGLQVGDEVVVNPSTSLSDGAKVTPSD